MASIKVKVIRPKKMNDRAFYAAIGDMLEDTEKGIKKDFTDTTETWKHKVKFNHGHSISPSKGRAYTETDDEIYGYVNNGTPEHNIPKRGSTFMRFQWGGKGSYRAKTKPRRFGSRPGGPSGPTVVAFKVRHPGTEAREFDKIIAKRWKTLLPRAVRSALGKGAKASGHGIP